MQAEEWDPHTLQQAIPVAAGRMHTALQQGGRVYVHCKAGQGRAGSACIAFLFWYQGMDLSQVRTCQAFERLQWLRNTLLTC